MISKKFIVTLIGIAVLSFGSYTFWHANRQRTAEIRKVYKATPIGIATKDVPEQVPAETSANLNHETELPDNGTELVKSIMTDEQLTHMQGYFKVAESDEFRKFKETNSTLEETFNFLANQGIGDLPRNLNMLLFRESFPTEDPADFEPEMRRKLMQMLIEAGVGPREPVPSEIVARAQALTPEEINHVNGLLDQYSIKETIHRLQISDPGLAEVFQYGADTGLEHEKTRGIIREFWADKRAFHWRMGYFKGKFSGEGSSYEWAQEVLSNVNSPVTATPAFIENTEQLSPTYDEITDTAKAPAVITPRNYEGSSIPEASSDVARKEVVNPAETSTDPETKFFKQFTDEGFVTELQVQFSPERLNTAMKLLNRYGPKEGLRRLKESDPEFAKQVEHHIGKSEEER
jgi:hypothetical protein